MSWGGQFSDSMKIEICLAASARSLPATTTRSRDHRYDGDQTGHALVFNRTTL
jgi:hypothetical protein